MGLNPAKMEMVQYWKSGDMVEAKIVKKDGVNYMYLNGEKYPFPGFPRGYLLFGKLSKLKHEIKNQIFNDNWKRFKEDYNVKDIILDIRQNSLPNIYKILDTMKFDMVPEKNMVPSVKELSRAWTKCGFNTKLRDLICFILQEDDSYRFRFQWLTTFFPFFKKNPVKILENTLVWLERAEVIGDMKERIRLFRTIIVKLLEDEHLKDNFIKLFREIDWKKVKMSKADKYYFRGKYFKVDLDKFDY